MAATCSPSSTGRTPISATREDLGWFRFMDAATGTNFFKLDKLPRRVQLVITTT